MSWVHEQAWAAYQAQQQTQHAEARALIVDVLGIDADQLDVVDVDVTGQRTRTVLTDGTVHLAAIVRTAGDGEVALVEPMAAGQWREIGRVTSLAGLIPFLGEWVPEEEEPPEYPVWYQRHAPDGWPAGSIVWFPDRDGDLWQATVGNNTWQPGAYGWEKLP